jgi:hypothetical protein
MLRMTSGSNTLVISIAASGGSSLQTPAMFIQPLPSVNTISMVCPPVTVVECIAFGGTISADIVMSIAPVFDVTTVSSR